jgi:hypothetical protein
MPMNKTKTIANVIKHGIKQSENEQAIIIYIL